MVQLCIPAEENEGDVVGNSGYTEGKTENHKQRHRREQRRKQRRKRAAASQQHLDKEHTDAYLIKGRTQKGAIQRKRKYLQPRGHLNDAISKEESDDITTITVNANRYNSQKMYHAYHSRKRNKRRRNKLPQTSELCTYVSESIQEAVLINKIITSDICQVDKVYIGDYARRNSFAYRQRLSLTSKPLMICEEGTLEWRSPNGETVARLWPKFLSLEENKKLTQSSQRLANMWKKKNNRGEGQAVLGNWRRSQQTTFSCSGTDCGSAQQWVEENRTILRKCASLFKESSPDLYKLYGDALTRATGKSVKECDFYPWASIAINFKGKDIIRHADKHDYKNGLSFVLVFGDFISADEKGLVQLHGHNAAIRAQSGDIYALKAYDIPHSVNASEGERCSIVFWTDDNVFSDLSPEADVSFSAESYVVDKVVNHRTASNFIGYEYFVLWKGYDEEESEWIPESNFDKEQTLERYWKNVHKNTSLNK